MENSDSILTSIKKLLGIAEECDSFDADIIANINSAIFVLSQLGVGSKEGYVVESKENTYHDFLDDDQLIQQVRMFLYYKVRLGFDPPTNASLLQSFQENIREAEWRMMEHVEMKKACKGDAE